MVYKNCRGILSRAIVAIEYSDFRISLSILQRLFSNSKEPIPTQLATEVTNLVYFLFARTTLADRAAFVRSIAESPNLPVPLTNRLLDEPLAISKPLLQYGRVPDLKLIAIIDQDTGERMLVIAQRRDLSDAVSDKLIAHGDERIWIALIGNRTARLSRRGLNRLMADARSRPGLVRAIGSRPDLPPPTTFAPTPQFTPAPKLERDDHGELLLLASQPKQASSR